MTPRATWSPHPGRKRTLLAAGIIALLALFLAASPAAADLTSVTTLPEYPTTCDSVALVVAGTTPTPCYEIAFTEVNGPVLLPTMGPVPTYEIRARIVLRHVTPPGGACPTVIQPYQKVFPFPLPLPFGTYHVRAVEYLAQSGSETPQDTLTSSFSVRFSDACPPRACVVLGFGPRPAGDRSCDVVAPPGGRASLPIILMNPVPVGGVQTVVIPYVPVEVYPQAGPVVADSHLVVVPVDVVTTDRTAGFQVAWTAEGDRARVLLYSATGAEIAPGQGPIFRVIYQVSSHAEEGMQMVRLSESLVADPLGQSIPPCPTTALGVDFGRICIGAPGCDLNEDGTSNILDVVQLVNCALAGAGGSESCPDSLAAHADCNGDGSIDVRDVICCVRKILGLGGFGAGDPGGGTGESTRIGFAGPVRWITPLTGRVELTVTPGTDFAGIDFAIDASRSKARITGMRLAAGSGYQLESSVAFGGAYARAMLLAMNGAQSAARSTDGSEMAASATVVVELTPSFSSAEWGSLSLASVQSASRSALTMPTLMETASAPVPEVATPMAPSVTAARPNPFRDETEIAYALPAATRATLRVYAASGRLVRTLVDSELPAGVHVARWDGKDSSGRPVSSGIYFFRFSAAEVTKTQRLMLLR